MESFNAPFAALSGPSMGIWLIVVAVGVAVALLTLGLLGSAAVLLDPLRRRLGLLRDGDDGGEPGSVAQWLGRIGPLVQPRSESARVGLRERLVRAGFKSSDALTVMYAGKVLLVIGVVAAVLLVASGNPHPKLSVGLVTLFAAGAGYFGWLLPNVLLDHFENKRKRLLLEGLPDALDLLVSCTEAGLGFNAAVERVAEQMPMSNPELGLELQQVNAEIRAGVERSVALRNLADRTGVEDIRGLVALISHSMRFGTGIADTLRVYAEEFRDKRMQRAEEAAAKIGTKLILPMLVCIFPAFFVVAIGPAVINIAGVFGGLK
jgi:tight adherence protein C